MGSIFKFRPLHSLLSSWTVFFLTPTGELTESNPFVYITAILVPLSFLFVKNHRLLILGLCWIFLSFLPQSLSNMSQFLPGDMLGQSLSRHLYLPSIGAALVYTALIYGIRDRFSARLAVVSTIFFLLFYVPYNYRLLSARGEQWYEVGNLMKRFLITIKKTVPQFPPNTHVYVVNTPAGRAFIENSLRAFYKNDSITYIVNPQNYHPKPGETAVLITCNLTMQGDVTVQLSPFE